MSLEDAVRRRDTDAPLWFCAGILLHAALTGGPDARGATHGTAPTPATPRDPDAFAARELRALPGIGPTRALAVARARWEGLRGGPSAWTSVPGIGDSTVRAASSALSSAAMERPSERAYTRLESP